MWEKNEREKVPGRGEAQEGDHSRSRVPSGTLTKKAQFCLAGLQTEGTRRRPYSDERSDREPIAQRI